MAFAKGAARARVQAVKTFRPAAFLQVGPGWARFSPERVGNTLMPGRRAMKSAYFIRSYAVFHEIRPDSETPSCAATSQQMQRAVAALAVMPPWRIRRLKYCS
jgi:hypothetical protein